jgi:hypothetical protein
MAGYYKSQKWGERFYDVYTKFHEKTSIVSEFMKGETDMALAQATCSF